MLDADLAQLYGVTTSALNRPEFENWRSHFVTSSPVMRGRRRLGFEFKRTVAPTVTASMKIALQDLELTRLDVIHAGDKTYPLAPRIRAVSFARIIEDLEPLPTS